MMIKISGISQIHVFPQCALHFLIASLSKVLSMSDKLIRKGVNSNI